MQVFSLAGKCISNMVQNIRHVQQKQLCWALRPCKLSIKASSVTWILLFLRFCSVLTLPICHVFGFLQPPFQLTVIFKWKSMLGAWTISEYNTLISASHLLSSVIYSPAKMLCPSCSSTFYIFFANNVYRQ